jgi:GDSL-like lipase/acylhydrolase family protein
MRRPPDWLLSFGAVAFFATGLGAIELCLRVVDPDYLNRLHGDESSNVYSEAYGWELRKGFRGVDFGQWATVNRMGYRGPEHEYRKPPGRMRILMLGDSIAYGAGVRDDETFSALLERRDPPFDVVNLAVGGYGTDQELIQLTQKGLRYDPDVVILNFCLFSDFVDDALSHALFDARQPKPFFTWDGQALVKHDDHLTLSFPRKLAQRLSDQSHFYNRLRVLLGAARAPRQPGVWMERMAAVERNLPPALDLTFRLIRRMNEEAVRTGARFFVLIHPDKVAFRHRSKLLSKFCRTPLLEGISIIEMGERYRAKGLSFDQIAFDSPGHLNKVGHEAAADAIASLLSGSAESWDYRRNCDPAAAF